MNASCFRGPLCAVVLLAASVGLSETYYWNSNDGAIHSWADASNWLVDDGAGGKTAATVAPGAGDSIARNGSGNRIYVDLGGGDVSIGKIDLTGGSWIADYILITNGTLRLTSGVSTFYTPTEITIADGSLIASSEIRFGHANYSDKSMMPVTIEEGGLFEIAGDYMMAKVQFTVREGGVFRMASTARGLNANANVEVPIYVEGGLLDMPAGFNNFNDCWSYNPHVYLNSGTWLLGGIVSYRNNIKFYTELNGGTLEVTNAVSFNLHENAWAKFADGADVTIQADGGSSIDMSCFTYEGSAAVTTTGSGTIVLPALPSSLTATGTALSFAAVQTSVMDYLRVGTGGSLSLAGIDLQIASFGGNEGTLTFASPNTVLASVAAGAPMTGTFALAKDEFSADDVIVTVSAATLKEKIIADLTAAGIAVSEQAGAIVYGGTLEPEPQPQPDVEAESYVWNKTQSRFYKWGSPASWLVGGEEPATGPLALDTIADACRLETLYADFGGYDWAVANWDWSDSHGQDLVALTNGSLTVTGNATYYYAAIDLWKDMAFSFDTTSRAVFSPGWTGLRSTVTVHDGASFEIKGYLEPRVLSIVVEEGGEFLYGEDVRCGNCNVNEYFILENRGTMRFPAGLHKFQDGGWSFKPYLKQYSGLLEIGGEFYPQNNNVFSFEFSGGTIRATDDVDMLKAMKNNGSYGKIMEDADLVFEIATGKTFDMTCFTAEGDFAVTIASNGVVKLPATPTKLSVSENGVFTADSAIAIGELGSMDGTFNVRASGLTLGELADGATLDGAFDFTGCEFAIGITFATVSNATLRAKFISDLNAALPGSLTAASDGNSVVLESAYTFSNTVSGDLTDGAAWTSGSVPPAGVDVVVKGTGVNAYIDDASKLPAWTSLQVMDGATLEIKVGDGNANIPSLIIQGESEVTVTSGTATLGAFSAYVVDDGMPTLTVAPGATLTVPGGQKFRNVALDVKGAIVGSSNGSLYFGYADYGETSRFAMSADGATITTLNASNSKNGGASYFAAPAAGGTVEVEGDIVLRNTAITYSTTVMNGVIIGLNNPTTEVFKVVADHTDLHCVWDSYVAGAAELVLTNGSLLVRDSPEEGDQNSNYFEIFIQNRGRVTVNDGCEIRSRVGRVNNNLTEGCLVLDPDEAGWVAVDVKDGGVLCWYKTYGNGKAVVRFGNATFELFKSYWWGWGNRSHVFNFTEGVEIPAEKTLLFKGIPDDKVGSNDHKLSHFEIESPFTGFGDLVVTNTWSGKTMQPTFIRNDNTCTGTLLAENGVGTARTLVHFADGANWAGTVVFNGNVDLVPVDDNHLNAATTPCAVSFGSVRLAGDLSLRFWKDGQGQITNDSLSLTGGFVREPGDTGIIRLVGQDDAQLVKTDRLVLGTFPRGAFDGVKVKCGYRTCRIIESEPDEQGRVTCSAVLSTGTLIFLR